MMQCVIVVKLIFRFIYYTQSEHRIDQGANKATRNSESTSSNSNNPQAVIVVDESSQFGQKGHDHRWRNSV